LMDYMYADDSMEEGCWPYAFAVEETRSFQVSCTLFSLVLSCECINTWTKDDASSCDNYRNEQSGRDLAVNFCP